LNFRNVNNSLKIINQQNKSVFVPLEIDISLVKDYIKALNELGIPYSEVIKGTDIWIKFSAIINDQDEDFIKNKIQMKKLQSLMSLFTFSIFPSGNDYETIRSFGRDGKEEYGFLYLEAFQDIYSFESGINTEHFSESNFL
jgi:CRISPR-associated endonuclease/helicase Cas3